MVEKIATPSDLRESTIMPSVTVQIPMPPGAATPAQPPTSAQAAQTSVPAAAASNAEQR